MKLSFQRPASSSIALLAVLATLTGCGKPDTPAPPVQTKSGATPASTGIAWREGDVDGAFAEAKASGKPLMLYWGAVWCPPCNQLQATLFKDPAFIELTRKFVAVHLDVDLADAQKWGDQFNVKGYPTIIVLRSDRSLITRLAGYSDNARLADALQVAATQTMTSEQLLDRALKTPKELRADDWTLLAGYDWWGMAREPSKTRSASDVLAQLAASAPQPALQRRFALLALSIATTPPVASPAHLALLKAVLADPSEVRANRTELSRFAPRLVMASTSDPGERAALSLALNQALDKVYADATLPIVDRMITASTQIDLARLAQGQTPGSEPKKPQPPLPTAVLDTVRQRVQWAVQTAKTDEERRSVISGAAGLLDQTGDNAGAEQLLLGELTRSKTPNHYMQFLAELAQERNDPKTAVMWLKKSYEGSQGPVMRVQSAIRYADGVIRLSPQDTAAIESATAQVIDELAGQPDRYGRHNLQNLKALGTSLKTWSTQHHREGSAVLARLQQKMQASCDSKNTSGCSSWLS
ncbi:thioredoxin family protein [Xanthomonas hortorum]|uniref:Thiol:disulfide interchange protein DsbD n=3 Tax=Xanthomonas hortorum TaxID=56454 RepID=A0A6V7BQW8_9XANT|nr:thioredoxin family protein [Xanthomonas hortorum]APP82086.1 dihydroneopterin aldolase [Xanthomonas hortorum pv. gardneri]EGD18657.1 thiol:disulfide interchange protein [Xanthomonas hortorum ATCC 19865]KLA95563.1 dihydroneopterin aldolase [Xanthomonas hortorum pv. gardneri]KLA98710.1 dihydroneopterin aldolase [Xanthomonas hortorum pv. gardneri]KLB04812.1 dihydroneopterin aldolase [Xanthomonas hortorum pv. gardneri]